MGSVREDIAKWLFKRKAAFPNSRFYARWEDEIEASPLTEKKYLNLANEILSLVCKRIEGAKLGIGDIANMKLNIHALYSPTRKLIEFGEQVSKAQVQAILDVIKEE